MSDKDNTKAEKSSDKDQPIGSEAAKAGIDTISKFGEGIAQTIHDIFAKLTFTELAGLLVGGTLATGYIIDKIKAKYADDPDGNAEAYELIKQQNFLDHLEHYAKKVRDKWLSLRAADKERAKPLFESAIDMLRRDGFVASANAGVQLGRATGVDLECPSGNPEGTTASSTVAEPSARHSNGVVNGTIHATAIVHVDVATAADGTYTAKSDLNTDVNTGGSSKEEKPKKSRWDRWYVWVGVMFLAIWVLVGTWAIIWK